MGDARLLKIAEFRCLRCSTTLPPSFERIHYPYGYHCPGCGVDLTDAIESHLGMVQDYVDAERAKRRPAAVLLALRIGLTLTVIALMLIPATRASTEQVIGTIFVIWLGVALVRLFLTGRA